MSLAQHVSKFFLLDVMFRTCSFICLCLFCRISSFYAFFRLFNFTREPRIHWEKCCWKSRALYVGQLVVPLCCYEKSTKFHDEKQKIYKENTRLQMRDTFFRLQENWCCEMVTNMCCNPNKLIAAAQIIVNQKTGDRRNACVCLYRSLKLLTDDHSDLVAI